MVLPSTGTFIAPPIKAPVKAISGTFSHILLFTPVAISAKLSPNEAIASEKPSCTEALVPP